MVVEEKTLLPHMLVVTLDLFRLKRGARQNRGDEAYRKAWDQLIIDLRSFEKHSTLEHYKDYHSAVTELRTGLNYFLDNDFSGGFSSLERANHFAHVAFRQVTHFDDKILLSRLQVLYVLHEYQYFHKEACNKPSLQAKCHHIFNELCQTNQVLDAIHHELGSHSIFAFMSNSHAVEYRTVLEDVHNLNNFFKKYLGTAFLIYASENKIAHWKCMKPLKLARTTAHTPEHPIQCIEALGDELYYSDIKGLTVWNIRTNTKINTFKVSETSEIKCMIEHNNQVITGSYDGAIRVWDMFHPGFFHRLDTESGVICMKMIHGKLYVSSHDRKVRCFDLITFLQVELYQCEHECTDFAMVGSTLYISAMLNELHLWDRATQVKIEQIEVPCDNIVYMHETLLFGVDTYRTKIVIYDLLTFTVVHTIEETAISLYVWGNILVVENTNIEVWDLVTYGKVRTIETKDGVKDVIINDNRLFYSDGKSVRMYLI